MSYDNHKTHTQNQKMNIYKDDANKAVHPIKGPPINPTADIPDNIRYF